ncbi:gamma-glutamyl-gamma-aminobutyrate hydrolase family protein [Nocardioides sp.]|uniref:gamma-glutamyl-gamma-aminobutyrate hydrolase family protein n=1 Tax=Nocardioides sp. TaxID=35761 RepID=UPI002736D7D0|nr:gamma-glutamyl-gamma-aminobutyrate hydrolase family protein [Nocardioides sp.]MDP3894282.1 gamma-glutamyl-gamma-aminobutyrate hydrolase family protein [Nocardioides sp.]
MVSSASDRRPRIGLTTYHEDASWGIWARTASLVPQVYVDAVLRAGGSPVLLPEGCGEDIVELLDGVVLIGGGDVDPAAYDEEPHPRTAGTRPSRDDHESRVLRAALDHDVPVLAVCRGAQVLNVLLGGSLLQHLPDTCGHDGHRPAPAVFGSSEVQTEPGSLAAEVLGPQATVQCYHHQAIARVADDLRVTAMAADGTIEAVELARGELTPGWVLGIQWHPEEDAGDNRLFDAHVRAARERSARSETTSDTRRVSP